MSQTLLRSSRRLRDSGASDLNGKSHIKPLKYGEFLYPGKKTYFEKNQYIPKIEEFPDILENDDHHIPLEELANRLETDITQGLKEDQILSIRERYGENILTPQKTKPLHCLNLVRGTYSFLCAGIIFCFVTAAIPSERPPEPYALENLYIGLILVVMLFVSIDVSLWQEAKCKRTLNAFKDLYPQYASVFRDGKKVRIHRREIVVGDLVLLKAGNIIPADIRITKSWNMKIDESSIKNTSNTAMKTAECTCTNPAVSENVVFFGSSCVDGYGQGIAFATGDRTAYGQMMKKTVILQEMDSVLHKRLRKILFSIGALTLMAGFILLSMTLVAHYLWTALVLMVFALVIDSMPDILYSAITVSLYTTAKEIVSKNCLPKNFDAVANLSSVTVICCDKTGTITQNRMTVVHLWIDDKIAKVYISENVHETTLRPSPDRNTWFAFSRAASLCSTITSKSRRNRCVIRKGCSCDQSEVAIMEFVNNVQAEDTQVEERVDGFRQSYKKVFEIPYNSHTKYHVTIHDTSESPYTEESLFLLSMKGAIEEILKFCSTALINGKNEPIEALQDLQFQNKLEKYMEKGERIFGFCDYNMPEEKYTPGYMFQESDIPITGLRFLGFVSMLDPPRASVPEAIKKCREAGIKVVLTTGDHPITAKAIATKVGIISSMTKDDIMVKYNVTSKEFFPGIVKAAVVTGADLELMETRDFQKLIRDSEELVFARITPEQKIRIVQYFQRAGEVVAVTGNSCGDAKAMQKADIGIGMGTHGCDVSREAADFILLGDNFDSIVVAIEEGRIIYDNLQKAMVYVLSSNVPQIFPFFVMGLIHIPFPMGAGFILIINLIAKTCPVLILAKERSSNNIDTKTKIGHRNFFNRRIFEKAYFQVGVVGVLSSMFIYFLIMAQNGFMPMHIFDIAKQWNSPAINDLVDSFNQEWDYASRKSLEYTCQTAFFLSIMILQFFNLLIIRTRVYSAGCYFNFRFLISSAIILGYQVMIILLLMYTPVVSEALHFYPLKISDWLMCLPYPFLLLAFEEFRRYLIRHSSEDAWLKRETF